MIDLSQIAIWIEVENPETHETTCHQRTIKEIVTTGSVFELNYLREWICEAIFGHEFNVSFNDFCWEVDEQKAKEIFEKLVSKGVKLDSCILGDLDEDNQ